MHASVKTLYGRFCFKLVLSFRLSQINAFLVERVGQVF